MPREISHYTITVDVDRRYAPGLEHLANIVGEGLEALGAYQGDYEVEVHGPPELRIRMVPR